MIKTFLCSLGYVYFILRLDVNASLGKRWQTSRNMARSLVRSAVRQRQCERGTVIDMVHATGMEGVAEAGLLLIYFLYDSCSKNLKQNKKKFLNAQKCLCIYRKKRARRLPLRPIHPVQAAPCDQVRTGFFILPRFFFFILPRLFRRLCHFPHSLSSRETGARRCLL